jgi:hypothetical protein
VYVDESGDHSLTSIDEDYPIFVLTFSIFQKNTYIKDIVPSFQKLKFKYFGHDIIILHENEIRRRKNDFKQLYNKEIFTNFINDLSQTIKISEFKIITCVIDKKALRPNLIKDSNPYHIALEFCLKELHNFIDNTSKKTHIVVEKRGKKEDLELELELEFRRLCDKRDYNFDIILADKKTNSIGLQLSDMIARPIGKHFINSEEENRAYDIIKTKLYKSGK